MIDGPAAQCECRQADLDCMVILPISSQVAACMLQVMVVEAGIRAVNLGLANRQQRLLSRRRERQLWCFKWQGRWRKFAARAGGSGRQQ